MKEYIRCIKCGKILGVIDEVEFTQFGMPEETCEACKLIIKI